MREETARERDRREGHDAAAQASGPARRVTRRRSGNRHRKYDEIERDPVEFGERALGTVSPPR
jgi:hypothetical protein